MSIRNLPPLIVGGAVFNTQYNANPHNLSVAKILKEAFSKGFNAIDTSPYYGPSEELFGKALKEISHEWKREDYMICTKAGRLQLDDFDYSRPWVRLSVLRSLKRLGTTYLDLVYMHDIEFVDEVSIIEAVKELKLMKDEGIIRNIGVSGYPVDFLYKIALQCKNEPDIGPLDVVMSYSNGCIQNEILFEYYEKFLVDCGLKKILNGSILSMSLLRSGKTYDFHPASKELREKVEQVADDLQKEDNVELADLATKFALRRWLFDTQSQANATVDNLEWNKNCSIVLGVSNIEELNVAIENYGYVKSRKGEAQDERLFKKVKQNLGDFFNDTWNSGIPH